MLAHDVNGSTNIPESIFVIIVLNQNSQDGLAKRPAAAPTLCDRHSTPSPQLEQLQVENTRKADEMREAAEAVEMELKEAQAELATLRSSKDAADVEIEGAQTELAALREALQSAMQAVEESKQNVCRCGLGIFYQRMARAC
jgi:DNA repair exonuclease SbcCD ATPase subunit